MTIVNYKVTGMSCHGCEQSVEMAVSKLPGVEVALANAQSNSLEVRYEDTPAPRNEVRKAIEESGHHFAG